MSVALQFDYERLLLFFNQSIVFKYRDHFSRGHNNGLFGKCFKLPVTR